MLRWVAGTAAMHLDCARSCVRDSLKCPTDFGLSAEIFFLFRVQMREITKDKDGVDVVDDWLKDGGSTVENPSAGPSGMTAGAPGDDDWIVDAHPGAGGENNQDTANKEEQGGPTGDGEVRSPALCPLPSALRPPSACLSHLLLPPSSTPSKIPLVLWIAFFTWEIIISRMEDMKSDGIDADGNSNRPTARCERSAVWNQRSRFLGRHICESRKPRDFRNVLTVHVDAYAILD